MRNKIDWPRITVVTPSFNQGEFLEEAILSVLNQNYPNLEYFIIDGGSTDNSVNIVKKYSDKISWWVSEKDAGQSDAICKGFERANGDLIGWLNSDDVYFPGALMDIARAYVKNQTASLYLGAIATGDKNGRIRQCSVPSKPLPIFISFGLVAFGQPSTFFNAGLYRKVGGLNKGLYMRMDGDLIYRLLSHYPRAVVVNKMIAFFRWHETSKSTVSVDRYLKEQNEFTRSLNISPCELAIGRQAFRIYRLIEGGYFKSIIATKHYRGKTIDYIWQDNKIRGHRPICSNL